MVACQNDMPDPSPGLCAVLLGPSLAAELASPGVLFGIAAVAAAHTPSFAVLFGVAKVSSCHGYPPAYCYALRFD